MKLKRLTLIALIALIVGALRFPRVKNEMTDLMRNLFDSIRKMFAFLFAFTTKRVRDHVEFTKLTEN